VDACGDRIVEAERGPRVEAAWSSRGFSPGEAVSTETPTTALKDLESDLFSVTALRDWLAARGS